jgi:hypothetical protein
VIGPNRRGRALVLGLLAVAIACGGRSAERAPGPAPAAPRLAGERVMLLPVQTPGPEQLDAELAYWLRDALPAVDWLMPTELQAAADRAPAWRLRLASLSRPVLDMGGNDRRIIDPLYGALRQLGAVVNADLALVPVSFEERADSSGTRLDLTMAVVDIRGGRVLWLHRTRSPATPGGTPALASLAEAVARSLVP